MDIPRRNIHLCGFQKITEGIHSLIQLMRFLTTMMERSYGTFYHFRPIYIYKFDKKG